MNKRIAAAGLLAIIAASGIAVWTAFRLIAYDDPAAEIYQNGTLIKTLPLSADCELTIEYEGGYNLIKVENGAVFVAEADCPDKVCVKTGAISGGAAPIVCLPHRLEIRIIDAKNSEDTQI